LIPASSIVAQKLTASHRQLFDYLILPSAARVIPNLLPFPAKF